MNDREWSSTSMNKMGRSYSCKKFLKPMLQSNLDKLTMLPGMYTVWFILYDFNCFRSQVPKSDRSEIMVRVWTSIERQIGSDITNRSPGEPIFWFGLEILVHYQVKNWICFADFSRQCLKSPVFWRFWWFPLTRFISTFFLEP